MVNKEICDQGYKGMKTKAIELIENWTNRHCNR